MDFITKNIKRYIIFFAALICWKKCVKDYTIIKYFSNIYRRSAVVIQFLGGESERDDWLRVVNVQIRELMAFRNNLENPQLHEKLGLV